MEPGLVTSEEEDEGMTEFGKREWIQYLRNTKVH